MAQTHVNFYKGTHANLPKSNYTPGAFYLTTDTSRLYFANSSDKLLDLNKYILFVDSINDLTGAAAQKGDIYYCTRENVMATWTGSSWQQINANTNTDTRIEKWDQEVTADGSGVKVKLTLTTKVFDVQAGDWVKDSSSAHPIEFVIDKDDIYAAIPEPKVDVTSKKDGANVKVTTSGDGSAGDGFVITPGNGVSLASSTADNIVIDATTYTLSSPANDTAVYLKDQANGAAGKTTFKAGNQLTVSGTKANEISYAHGTITTDTSTQVDNKSGFGAEIAFVKSINYDNGHITDIDLGTLTLPAEPQYDITSVSAGTGDNAGDLTIAIKDKAGSGHTSSVTAQDALYYVIDDVKYYNTEALPVYTIEQIENKLKGVNAMTYQGTVNGDTLRLPSSGVRIGDTYKSNTAVEYSVTSPNKFVDAEGAEVQKILCEIGDLFIATGTEDASTGYITGGIAWTYIPAGDDLDSQYELEVKNNKVILKDISTPGVAPGSAEFAAGLDLEVNTTTAGKNGKITYKHAAHAGTNDPKTATKSAYSGTFTAISELELSNGHIDKYVTTTYQLPDVVKDTLGVVSNGLKLKDSEGDSTTVTISDDDEVVATLTPGVNEKNGSIAFSHKAHAGTKSTKTAVAKSFGQEISAVTIITTDGTYGHVNSYDVTPFQLPADPSANERVHNVTAANNVVTVSDSVKQPNSTLKNSLDATTKFSTATNSIALGATTDKTTVTIDLVWGEF